MKKIMFNDKYGLTKAVLEGRKTQTRRIINLDPSVYRIHGYKTLPDGCVGLAQLRKDGVWNVSMKPKSLYKKGEEVAVAQSYMDCLNKSWIKYIHDIDPDVSYDRELSCSPGENNKMFVRAALMPHRIKITNIRVERLQDISDEDCLKEGIVERYITAGVVGYFLDTRLYSNPVFRTPREAFAYLIDKVSGKGTWDSNPYVFVYDFELIK